MNASHSNTGIAATVDVTTPPAHEAPEAGHKDHFLQLMFFRASRARHEPPGEPLRQPTTGAFAPLRNWRAQIGEHYDLPAAAAGSPVRPDSPATEVMTDLRRISAVTVDAGASIVEANRVMVARGVRALFVVDEGRRVLGIITMEQNRHCMSDRTFLIAFDKVTKGFPVTLLTSLNRLDIIHRCLSL